MAELIKDVLFNRTNWNIYLQVKYYVIIIFVLKIQISAIFCNKKSTNLSPSTFKISKYCFVAN